jgi:DUF1009 family protein
MPTAPRLGILAGGGAAPQELIAACRDMGRDFFVIALEEQAGEDLAYDVRIRLGAFGALKKICEEERLSEVVMLGRVRRPSMTELRPDFLGIKVIAKIGLHTLGDDGLLRAVCRAIEEECGVSVVGAHEVFREFLTPLGALTKAKPDDHARKDIKRAVKIVQALGALDVGQAAIVQRGLVLGVEAIEGTDALIVRSGEVKRAGGGGVLVKMSKPQQDDRFDLPTLGPSTIDNLARAGFAGVAVEAGRSLLLERGKTIAAANKAGLFIYGLASGECDA